jgi:hypothetical protein
LNLSHLPDIQQALHLSDNHVEYLDDEIEDHSYLFVVQFFYIHTKRTFITQNETYLSSVFPKIWIQFDFSFKVHAPLMNG